MVAGPCWFQSPPFNSVLSKLGGVWQVSDKGSELERVTMFFSFFGTRRAEPNCNKGKSKIHRNPEGLGRERNRTKLPYPIPLRGLRRID
jgi:hypothetical protein